MSQDHRPWNPYAGVDSPDDMAAPDGGDSPDEQAALLHRRDFLGLVGMTGAGAALSGCSMIRKPVEKILPYATRPEDLIPGNPLHYATAVNIGGAVLGVRVKSQEGRPIKVDGNPRHPLSRGASNAWAQGAVLEVYDDDRLKKPLQDGKEVEWAAIDGLLDKLAADAAKSKGEGFALLLRHVPSPTLWRLIGDLRKKAPLVKVYVHDLAANPGATRYSLAGAKRILSIDADFLMTEGDSVANARDFADGRRVTGKGTKLTGMNRLYAVGPEMTVTGAAADHRLRLKASQCGAFLAALATKLGVSGYAGKSASLPGSGLPASAAPFIAAVAEDLAANKGASLVAVGDRQPAHVRALGLLVNKALGNFGKTVFAAVNVTSPDSGIEALAEAIGTNAVNTLVVLDANPAYDAPSDLGMASLLLNVPRLVHVGLYRDETGSLANWNVPGAHYLESWGDLTASDGSMSIVQPLIAPMHDGRSAIEVIAHIAGGSRVTGYDAVRAQIKSDTKSWRRLLHHGVSTAAASAGKPELSAAAVAWPTQAKVAATGIEVVIARDASVLDGRFSNNPWLQENPDPITKLTWENAALISPATAAKLGLENGQIVRVGHGNRSIGLPAWIAKGTADDTVVIALGYGRRFGRTAKGRGADVNSLRTAAAPWIMPGATIVATRDVIRMAVTQDMDTLTVRGLERPMVRRATLAEFNKTPDFVKKLEVLPPERLHSLWEQPNRTDGHQWGMTIDLNACNGCGACTVACQVENNIATVGRTEVLNGRELHWIRIDRYFQGSDDDPECIVQPMMCAHCETAPCENVCPVAATTHSPEGLNDMAYNRCIGTRYCSNNCPFKVRRFNFYNYVKRDDEHLGEAHKLVRNPDVTVRFRGVMEKCTYCVQSINRARSTAKRETEGIIADGAIEPACEAACPTDAIVFGNINDPNSRVSKAKSQPRNYAVLSELNLHPRTTYLARLSNPNAKLRRPGSRDKNAG